MPDAPPVVRTFDTARHAGTVQLAPHRIFLTPAVEAAEGGPLSAYTAHLGAGERADLPAPYAEVWVVLAGRLRVTGAGADRDVRPGEFLHVPEQTPGAVEVVEDATLVCVSAPAH